MELKRFHHTTSTKYIISCLSVVRAIEYFTGDLSMIFLRNLTKRFLHSSLNSNACSSPVALHDFSLFKGAGRSSEVERSLMVRWVVGSIFHGVDPLSYFSFQPVLHDWCTKGRGMCYPVCVMVHIKEPLLLIDKSSLCGDSGFPFSLSEWSLTICLTPYNRR